MSLDRLLDELMNYVILATSFGLNGPSSGQYLQKLKNAAA